jgi:unsaturated rhamnogalacturonyl hydrolase
MRTMRQAIAFALIICSVLVADGGVKGSQTVIRNSAENYRAMGGGARSAAGSARTSDEFPGKIETLSLLRKVNTYQVEHPMTDAWQKAHPWMGPEKRPWPRATWYTGVMAAWKAIRDPSFLEQALQYGRQFQWGVGEEQSGADRLFPIEIWVELYFAKHDRAMIEPSIKWLDTPDPLTPAGFKGWYLDARDPQKSPIPYVDSLYGAPALAMLAKATGDKKYLNIMNAFFDDVTAQLFDRDSGLYFRDPNFISQRSKNGKKVLWSRGNGWAFAGIARVLEYLPKNDPSRARYLDIFRRQAAELNKRQGADGLWRTNLDDPEELPGPETSGSGFFCFGLAWGINHGVLNRQEYLPAVQKAWLGLTRSLSPEGKVLWGQLVDTQPNATERDSTHEYVTGAFLLAGSEVYKLAK